MLQSAPISKNSRVDMRQNELAARADEFAVQRFVGKGSNAWMTKMNLFLLACIVTENQYCAHYF